MDEINAWQNSRERRLSGGQGKSGSDLGILAITTGRSEAGKGHPLVQVRVRKRVVVPKIAGSASGSLPPLISDRG
jgi:hypothetical protein